MAHASPTHRRWSSLAEPFTASLCEDYPESFPGAASPRKKNFLPKKSQSYGSSGGVGDAFGDGAGTRSFGGVGDAFGDGAGGGVGDAFGDGAGTPQVGVTVMVGGSASFGCPPPVIVRECGRVLDIVLKGEGVCRRSNEGTGEEGSRQYVFVRQDVLIVFVEVEDALVDGEVVVNIN